MEEIKGNKDEEKKGGGMTALTKALAEAIMQKYNITNQLQAEKKLKEIKGERKELRGKLDTFQREFEVTHNRKIRYTKDIVKVQTEFKRYKDLK